MAAWLRVPPPSRASKKCSWALKSGLIHVWGFVWAGGWAARFTAVAAEIDPPGRGEFQFYSSTQLLAQCLAGPDGYFARLQLKPQVGQQGLALLDHRKFTPAAIFSTQDLFDLLQHAQFQGDLRP